MQAGFFERVAWPGNDIRDLIIESNQDKSRQVGANAKIIVGTITPQQSVSGGETVNFDFTAIKSLSIIRSACRWLGQDGARGGGQNFR